MNALSPLLKRGGQKNFFRAWRHKNYRLFFIGQSLSLCGLWMTAIALQWLAYKISPNPSTLGWLAFFGNIPILFLTPFAGAWLLGRNLKRILFWIQSLSMLQSFALALVAIMNWQSLPLLILLALAQGVLHAIELPTRHSMMIELIDDKADLINAISMNTFTINAARFVGPLLAGFIITLWGEVFCFILDGFSYMAVLISLSLINLPPKTFKKSQESTWQKLKLTLKETYAFVPTRLVLRHLAFFSLTVFSFGSMLPLYADQIFSANADSYGLMMSFVGLGALLAAFVMAQRKSPLGLPVLLSRAGVLFTVTLMIFSYSTYFYFSLLCLLILGFSLVTFVLSVNTFIQTLVEDEKRSGIIGLFTTSFVGMLPVGGALLGQTSTWLGTPTALFVHGALAFLMSLYFFTQLDKFQKPLADIYHKKGYLRPPIEETLVLEGTA